jgi:hypothetical protein
MKKIDTTIEWLKNATNALQEVENHLRELNYQLDKRHDINLRNEIRSEYGADKVERIMDYVVGEIGERYQEMTIQEIMDDIGSSDMCEWCGETTYKHSAEIMSSVGDEKVCVYCKGNG